MSVGVPGLVDEASSRREEETVLVQFLVQTRHEVLILMDCSLLPEGSVSNSLCPGWEGLATVVQSAPSCQMVNLPPVGIPIPTRDPPSEGGVVRKPQEELDRLVIGGAAVGIQGEEQRG